jgi:hypothetical protein
MFRLLPKLLLVLWGTCVSVTWTNIWSFMGLWYEHRQLKIEKQRKTSPAKTVAKYTRHSQIFMNFQGSSCPQYVEAKLKRSPIPFSHTLLIWRKGGDRRPMITTWRETLFQEILSANVIIGSLYLYMARLNTKITKKLKYKKFTRHWNPEWSLVRLL